MQCCQRNQEYVCTECGAGMKVTQEPQKEVDENTHATPQCFHCGAAMQRTQAAGEEKGARRSVHGGG